MQRRSRFWTGPEGHRDLRLENPPSRTLTIESCGDVPSFLTASFVTVKPASEEGWVGDKRSGPQTQTGVCATLHSTLLVTVTNGGLAGRDLVVPCALAPSGPPHRSLARLDPAAAKLQQLFDPTRGHTPQCALAGLSSCWAIAGRRASCMPH
jgi:hypothetical protein